MTSNNIGTILKIWNQYASLWEILIWQEIYQKNSKFMYKEENDQKIV